MPDCCSAGWIVRSAVGRDRGKLLCVLGEEGEFLLLADGKIAEEGTHEALMAKGGEYARLFEIQSRYYREGGEDDGGSDASE